MKHTSHNLHTNTRLLSTMLPLLLTASRQVMKSVKKWGKRFPLITKFQKNYAQFEKLQLICNASLQNLATCR